VTISKPELKVAMWDRVRDCIGKACGLFESCPFRRRILQRMKHYIDPNEYVCPLEYRKLRDRYGRKFSVDLHVIDPVSNVPETVLASGRLQLVVRTSSQENTLGQCLVEQQYMRSISQPLIRLMEEANDPFINQIIGYHLVPRYLDLLHLKMERLVNSRVVTSRNSVGAYTVNPIFREIRQASDSIIKLWKTSGLEEVARKVGFFHIGGKILPDEEDLEFDFEADGDPGSYDRMASGE
jgi:hypothetical protein